MRWKLKISEGSPNQLILGRFVFLPLLLFGVRVEVVVALVPLITHLTTYCDLSIVPLSDPIVSDYMASDRGPSQLSFQWGFDLRTVRNSLHLRFTCLNTYSTNFKTHSSNR